MENIEKFNLCAAHVLARLYREFPVSRKLPFEEIVTELQGAITDNIVDGINANSFVAHTINWLVEADYVRLMRESTTAVNNKYVLSPKALEILNARLPDALQAKQTDDEPGSIGDKLSEAATDLANDVGDQAKKQVVNETVKAIFGFGLKWITGA